MIGTQHNGTMVRARVSITELPPSQPGPGGPGRGATVSAESCCDERILASLQPVA
jgi:hypothetical protein